jgi:hypothetical protein
MSVYIKHQLKKMERVKYLEKLKAGRTLCLVRDETLEALVRKWLNMIFAG